MSVASRTQVGFKKEVTPGTGVVVDHFGEFTSETIKGRYGRTEAAGMRTRARSRTSSAPSARTSSGTPSALSAPRSTRDRFASSTPKEPSPASFPKKLPHWFRESPGRWLPPR